MDIFIRFCYLFPDNPGCFLNVLEKIAVFWYISSGQTAIILYEGLRVGRGGVSSMIKYLNGIHETVDFSSSQTQICLYHNNEYENYPPHWHTSFELIMPVKNGYRAVIHETEYSVREGDLLIICPCVIHELFAPETGERIIFQPSLNQISINDLSILSSAISPALLVTPELYPQIIDRIRQLMLQIEQEYQQMNSYSEVSIFSMFLELLLLVGRNCNAFSDQPQAGTGNRQREYMEKFLQITHYIDLHFSEDLSLEEAASRAGFSKYHFSRLFKMYTGTTFYHFLNQKRISYAKTLLADPHLTVLDVATRSGFSSLSSFHRMFRQMNCCTPTEFRALHA